MQKAATPYTQLVNLSARFKQVSKPLPAQGEVLETCTVVSFLLMGHPVVVLLDEIDEIIDVPSSTRLPRVKPWVKGVANIRGRLTPVVDFPRFLGGQVQSSPSKQKLLLVESGAMSAGLLVDEVLGMKHFPLKAFSEERKTIPIKLARYISGVFKLDESICFLFRPDALFNHNDFLNVTQG